MAVLVNPDNPAMGPIIQAMERTAGALRVGLQQYAVRGPDQFDGALSAMITNRVDAVTVIEDPMFQGHSGILARRFSEKRLPSLGFSEFAQAGGLVGYGIDIVGLFRRAASFVGRILKGAAPADLPVERPTKFELVINLKTAKMLGLTIPPLLLARADQVIE
jgi:putative ABC transport system substrate-binding protein